MIGQMLGHYRITGKLGEGGMGVVYRARDDKLQRDLAIKVLSSNPHDDSLARTRLLREARAAASLNHPNICTIYEVGEAGGQVYIAMEFVEGRLLSQLFESGPLSHEQFLRFALQLSEALSHAHDRGLIHRDLKSLNVIVTPEGRCKVLDFGLARRLPDENSEATVQTLLTEPGALVGTPAYMAPEQLRGQTADARSDVWALGVVLYEMATGIRPFLGKTVAEVTSSILSQEPTPLPAKVPIAVRAVIERCLEKEPDNRYSQAGEVRAELESIQQGTASALSAWSRRIRRRPVAVSALVLGLALLVGVAFNARSLRDKIAGVVAPSVESVAVLPLENLSGDPGQDYLADGITDALITELAKFGSLKRVIGRGSVMRYKGTQKSDVEIARELSVQSLIRGSVVRSLDKVSVNVSLINSANGQVLWGERYERDLRDILQLQNEIISSITQQMRLQMTPEDRQRLQQVRQVKPEAYEATLKGMVSWYKHTADDIEQAHNYFQRALEIDPEYAPAYAGLMWVWVYRGSSTVRPSEVIAGMEELGRKMKERGIEFDETQPEAFEGNADGQFYYEWNWADAGKNYSKALQMKPNSVDLRLFYWDYLAAMNKMSEARTMIERAVELDPYNPFANGSYGLYLLLDHRFDDAIKQFQKMIDDKLDFDIARGGLWTAYHQQGKLDEAFEQAKAFLDVPVFTETLELGYKENGYKGAMRRLAELMATQKAVYVLPTNIAKLYAYAGENDKALEYLERGYADHDYGLVHLQVDPDWDTLRKEPRFQALLAKMNFPK